DIKLNIEQYRHKQCLMPFDHLEYENTALDIHIRKTGKHQAAITQFVFNTLRSVQSDVMLMHYRVYRFNCKHQPAPLTYAERLKKHAKVAATLLYPYVAVHWRMETAAPSKLLKCSQNLVAYINHIKKKTGIANVYVATDYPIDGGRQHSGTFRKITRDHHRAANVLKSNIDFST